MVMTCPGPDHEYEFRFETRDPGYSYAGFFSRLASLSIDTALLVTGLTAFDLAQAPAGGMGLTVGTEGMLIIFLYYSLLESSGLQATVGKLVTGSIVVDEAGQRLTFLRAAGRTCARALTLFTLMIGFVAMAVSGKKQTLHDKLSGSYVVTKRSSADAAR